MTFPGFFVSGVLNGAGYPVTKGFLTKREIVPAGMIDAVFIQLVKASASLGAKRPEMAARLLTSLFQPPEWSDEETLRILENADPHLEVNGLEPRFLWTQLAHTMSLGILRTVKPTDEISWTVLRESSLTTIYTGSFASALVWGLLHPDEAIMAIYSDANPGGLLGTAELLAEHGLSVTTAQSIDEICDNIETLIEAYEVNYELPKQAPQSLLTALNLVNDIPDEISTTSYTNPTDISATTGTGLANGKLLAIRNNLVENGLPDDTVASTVSGHWFYLIRAPGTQIFVKIFDYDR